MKTIKLSILLSILSVTIMAQNTNLPIDEETGLITYKEVVEEKGEREVTGALFERKIPRIVSIDGFGVEVEPEGNILLCYGLDKPGLIGKIGKILGDKGINIARMTFSRKRKGGEAITVLNVDSQVSERIREEIEKLEDIDKAEVIVL